MIGQHEPQQEAAPDGARKRARCYRRYSVAGTSTHSHSSKVQDNSSTDPAALLLQKGS